MKLDLLVRATKDALQKIDTASKKLDELILILEKEENDNSLPEAYETIKKIEGFYENIRGYISGYDCSKQGPSEVFVDEMSKLIMDSILSQPKERFTKEDILKSIVYSGEQLNLEEAVDEKLLDCLKVGIIHNTGLYYYID